MRRPPSGAAWVCTGSVLVRDMRPSYSVNLLLYVRHRTERPGCEVKNYGNARLRQAAEGALPNSVVLPLCLVAVHCQATQAGDSLSDLCAARPTQKNEEAAQIVKRYRFGPPHYFAVSGVLFVSEAWSVALCLSLALFFALRGWPIRK